MRRGSEGFAVRAEPVEAPHFLRRTEKQREGFDNDGARLVPSGDGASRHQPEPVGGAKPSLFFFLQKSFRITSGRGPVLNATIAKGAAHSERGASPGEGQALLSTYQQNGETFVSIEVPEGDGPFSWQRDGFGLLLLRGSVAVARISTDGTSVTIDDFTDEAGAQTFPSLGHISAFARVYNEDGSYRIDSIDMDVTMFVGGHWFGRPTADLIIGTEGVNYLHGGGGNDIIHGSAGDDGIAGDGVREDSSLSGDDVIYGGDGSDFLFGGSGSDWFDGGSGLDSVTFHALWATRPVSANLMTQTILDDGFGNSEQMVSIEMLGEGTPFADLFVGDDGPFHSLSGSFGDTLRGMGGDDHFNLSGAPAMVDGGTGDESDVIAFDQRFTWLPDSDGDGLHEKIITMLGVEVDLDAGMIIDDGFGRSGTLKSIEMVFGSPFGDRIFGTESKPGQLGNNFLTGQGGDDVISGRSGSDYINGGDGDDELDGGADHDTAGRWYAPGPGFFSIRGDGDQAAIYRDAEKIDLISADGATLIFEGINSAAHLGKDRLVNFEWIDLSVQVDPPQVLRIKVQQRSSPEADYVVGLGGDDVLDGYEGHDGIFGLAGADKLFGGEGNDELWGGGDDDELDGGSGNDQLHGGSGNDRFVFQAADFAPGQFDTVDGGTGTDPNAAEKDVIKLPGKANDYRFDTVFNGTDPTHTYITHLATGAAIRVQNVEAVKFDLDFDNAVFGSPGLLDGSEVVEEMVLLGNESYGPQPTLSHLAEKLASSPDAVPAHTSGVAGAAVARGWRPLSAIELGIAANATMPDGLNYALTNGHYQAINPSLIGDLLDTPEANALVMVGIVDGKRTLSLSFRGTDQVADFTDYFSFRSQHYAKFAPLISAVDAYIVANKVEQVLVSGHSLGGAMVQLFMDDHPGPMYRAVTIGSPGSDNSSVSPADPRLVNFVHIHDPVGTRVEGATSDEGKAEILLFVARFSKLAALALAPVLLAVQPKLRDGPTILIDTDLFFLDAHNSEAYLNHVRQLTSFAEDGASPFFNSEIAFFLRGATSYSGSNVNIAVAANFGGTIFTNPGNDYVLGSVVSDTIEWRGHSGLIRIIDGGDGNDKLSLPGVPADWAPVPVGDGRFDLYYRGEIVARLARIEKLYFPDVKIEGEPLPGRAAAAQSQATSPVIHLDGSEPLVQEVAAGTSAVIVDPNVDYVDIGDGDRSVHGSGGDDFIFLGAGAQAAFGDGGNDIIVAQRGGAGSSYIIGGGGGDDIIIGDGLAGLVASFSGDLADYAGMIDGAGRLVLTDRREGSPDGTDRIAGASQLAFADRTLTVGQFLGEFITATFVGTDNADLLAANPSQAVFAWGLGGNDQLNGGPREDLLDGGAGADSLAGGPGDDLYLVDHAGDVVIENDAAGNDEVRTSLAQYLLAAGVERLTGTSPAGQSLTGNPLDNLITGGSGDDRLDGGTGHDQVEGGEGEDTLIVAWGDLAAAVTGTGASYGAAGRSVAFTGIERFVITTGGGADTIVAGAGDDVVDGGLGADTLDGGDGIDTLSYTSRTTAISVSLATGASSEGDSLAGFENLIGGSAADSLAGGLGSNRLDGGAGNDIMSGGLGDDSYVVADAGDVVTELAGEGTDEIRTNLGDRAAATVVRYVLPANVENLTGTLGRGQALEDNAENNIITTGKGADLIVARHGGDDTISTGTGADFIFFGNAFTAADSVDAGGGTGRDKLGLHGDYALTLTATSLTGLEKLVMWTSGDPGNDFDYSITTHDGNVAAGTQLEVTALSLMASETLVFNGAAETNGAFWVRSGAGNDTITGGAGADRIMGGLGADILTGGGGADRFDMLVAAHSTGTSYDTLIGFDASLDRINVQPAFGGWGGLATGALSTATFDAQLAGLVDGLLGIRQAVKVTVDGGDLHGKIFVVFDVNGDGSYIAGQDLVWLFENPVQANLEGFNFFV